MRSQDDALVALGFARGQAVTAGEAKKRWKELCRGCHPDIGGDPKQFHRVTHAYKMLTDPEYRQQAINEEIKRGNRNARGDLNIRLVAPISFDDAFFGRRVLFSYNRLSFDENFKIQKQDVLEVVSEAIELDPGTADGHQVVIEGGGHRCGDVTGHAHVSFAIEPHEKFKLRGKDVVSTERVPLSLMVKGGKIDVGTMYGTRRIKVPVGTQPGQQIAIKGCGVSRSGVQIVELHPIFPTKQDIEKGGDWKGLELDKDTGEEGIDEEEAATLKTFDKILQEHLRSGFAEMFGSDFVYPTRRTKK